MKNIAKIALIATTAVGAVLGFGGCSNFFFENQFFKFVNHLPTATPYTNLNSLKVGESLICGAAGTDPDGVEDLKSYGMIIDYSDERQADENRIEEFPFEMTCIPQYPGKITITQWVKDEAGKRDTKNLEREVLANTPEPIKDMKMNYLFTGYHKGDSFNYSFDLTSQNPEGKTILIDSTKGGGIKLELYKTGIEAPVSTVLVDQRITLEMAMGGIFETQVETTQSTFKINEYCRGLWQGFPIWIPGPAKVTYPIGSDTLKEIGKYRMKTTIDYLFEGEDKLNKEEFISDEFEVT